VKRELRDRIHHKKKGKRLAPSLRNQRETGEEKIPKREISLTV